MEKEKIENKATYAKFAELSNQYRIAVTEDAKECLLEQMRENLIERNNGSVMVLLYSEPTQVNVATCDMEDLNKANYALVSNLNKKGK